MMLITVNNDINDNLTGGRDFPVEGNFTWTDGTTWNYTNWKMNSQAGTYIYPLACVIIYNHAMNRAWHSRLTTAGADSTASPWTLPVRGTM